MYTLKKIYQIHKNEQRRDAVILLSEILGTISLMITLKVAEFPPLLHEIPDPPKKLFLEGSLAPEDHVYLAVVGSRHYSDYARDAVDHLIRALSGFPISIVSGLAIGVDRLAHEAALKYKLHTVAVPGSGLNRSVLYPPRNRRLAEKILQGDGALLSEFEPHTKSARWNFPKRNRIMAGMAKATLIVEATLQSGTLITSRLATDYNREVLTIPGSIFSRNTVGPHMLLRLGATPITKGEHILEALGFDPSAGTQSAPALTEDEAAIIAALSSPQSRAQLLETLAMDVQKANIVLSMMELKEYIREQGGCIISRL